MAVPIIDVAQTFQGYISVKIVAGSKLRTKPFRVDSMTNISHGMSVYNTSAVASANRAKTYFYTDSGFFLSAVDHAFAVNAMWTDIKIEAVAVPTGATFAVLELYSTSGAYWATKIKSEEGQIATPYANNVSSYLTWITPRGIYTGNITANQITVVGGEPLSDRLVTINDRFVNLSSNDATHNSRLTSIEAGQITLTNNIGLNASKIGSLESLTGSQSSRITLIEAGQITLSALTSGSVAGMTLTSDRLEFSGTGSYFRLMSKSGYDFIRAGTSSSNIVFGVSQAGKLIASDAEITGKITATSGKIGGWDISSTYIDSTSGSARFYLASHADSASNYIYITNSSGTPVFTVSKSGALTATGVTITGAHYGSLNAVTGSLNGVTGSVSGITGSTGYISGTQFSGATAGYHTGTQSGAVYSSSGTLGSTNFTSYSGSLNFSTRVRSSSIVATSIYESNTIYGDLTLYGGFTNNSDIHFKQNVTPINKEPIIEGIYNLDLVNFEYKDREGSRIGIIANDVVSNLPNEFTKYTIFPNEDGYLTASYLNMSIMGIAAIQDLNERLKAVEEKLA